jgi:hypothetical protein
MKGLRDMRVVIEKYFDESGNVLGELVIESDALSYQVTHYSASFTKLKGVDTDKHAVINSVTYMTVAGCVKYILNRKIKESTATDLKELRADFLRLEAWIHELIQF